jgi:hypothetical protein
MNIENDDIIKIDYNIFIQKKKNYIYNDIIYDNLQKKKKELIQNYSCFNEKYDSKFLWEKKKMKKHFYNKPHDKYNNYYKNNSYNSGSNINTISQDKKVYTFTTNKFNTNKEKKLFISLLNKLSESNKDTIYNNITDIINNYNNIEELLDIIYIYIGKNNDKLYSKIICDIKNINEDIFYQNMYKLNYHLDKQYQDINIMLDENYDTYCDYKKYKLKFQNIFEMLIDLSNVDIKIHDFLEKINTDIYDIIHNQNEVKSYIINYYLDLLFVLNKKYKIEKIDIDFTKYDKSTKFIIDKFNF